MSFECPGVDQGRINDDADLPMHEFRERKVEKAGECDQCSQVYSKNLGFIFISRTMI